MADVITVLGSDASVVEVVTNTPLIGVGSNPAAGFALNNGATITGNSPSSDANTEFGGWGLGMEKTSDITTFVMVQPDGFRAFSETTEPYSTHLSSTALMLDNGAKLRKGTTDAQSGCYKGIALACPSQYELKWEAGRLYVLGQDGFTIRRVEHCGTSAPTVNDDETKGFTEGSRWVLDNGTTYYCGNPTEGDAGWSVVFTPTSLVYTSMLPNVQTFGGTSDSPKSGGLGGSIRMNGGNSGAADEDEGNGGSSGSINLSGEVGQLVAPWNSSGGRSGGNGGSLLMNAVGVLNGGSINTSAGGGSIDTSSGGGSISTHGTGFIQLGVTGTRTTLVGSASAGDKTITIPNATGTMALTLDFIYCRNILAPTINGTTQFTATTGSWTASPTSYDYQWQISNNGTSGWANLFGATTSSYAAPLSYSNKFVRVGVIASNINGVGTIAYSGSLQVTTSSNNSLPTGLLAFWQLSDVSDSSGNGKTLTNNNGVTFAAGRVVTAAVFDGSNNFSSSANIPNGDFTLSAWINCTATTDQCEVVGNFYGGGAALFQNEDNIYYANNPSAQIQLNGPSIVGVGWIHVVVRRSGNTFAMYVNGALYTNVTANTSISSSVTGVFIGKNTYYGKVDAVGIWSRALNASEISELYNSGAGIEL